jgi:hypothetical protein
MRLLDLRNMLEYAISYSSIAVEVLQAEGFQSLVELELDTWCIQVMPLRHERRTGPR